MIDMRIGARLRQTLSLFVFIEEFYRKKQNHIDDRYDPLFAMRASLSFGLRFQTSPVTRFPFFLCHSKAMRSDRDTNQLVALGNGSKNSIKGTLIRLPASTLKIQFGKSRGVPLVKIPVARARLALKSQSREGKVSRAACNDVYHIQYSIIYSSN